MTRSAISLFRRASGILVTFALVVAGLVAGLVAVAPAASAAPTCDATTCSITYGLTRSLQTFTVPADVTSVTATVTGASGGGVYSGKGGQTTATLGVTPGQNLLLLVGAGGGYNGDGVNARSYGGGGGVDPNALYASTGGGGSFVYNAGGGLLLAAGGGGGSQGPPTAELAPQRSGGDGNGAATPSNDGNGRTGRTDNTFAGMAPAYGGTQSAGGAGGRSMANSSLAHGTGSNGTGPASGGAPGDGGDGAIGGSSPGGNGGGGGGGYYGGGGGGYIMGAGGGSGFAAASASAVSSAVGVNTGDGSITLTWTSSVPTTTSLSASSASGAVDGDSVTLTATVASGGGTPTGTVTFKDGSVTISGCGAVPLFGGTATCVTYFAAGTRSLTAAYGGTGLFATSTGSIGSYSVAALPQVTTSSLANGTVGSAYSVALAAAGGSGGPYTFSLQSGSLPPGLTLSGAGMITGTPTTAGSVVFTIKVTDSASHVGTRSLSLQVEKAAQAVAFTLSPGTAVVDTTYTITDIASGAGTQPVVLTGNAVCSVSGTTVSFDHAGTCSVTATQAGDANHTAAAPLTHTVAVGRAGQSIAFTSTVPTSATVDGDAYTVTATGGPSGQPVTFTGGAGCTVTTTTSPTVGEHAATVSFGNAGTCVVTADQQGSSDYSAAAAHTQQIAVGKGAQAVNFDSTPPSDARVDGSYVVAASGGASGRPVTLRIASASADVCSLVGTTVTFDHVGTCVVTADQDGTADYDAAPQNEQSIAVGKADQDVVISSAAPESAKVDGSYDVVATGNTKSGVPVTITVTSDPATACSLADDTVAFAHVGTCTVTATQPGNADYTAGTAQQVITIGQATGTVAFSSTEPGTAKVGGSYVPTITAGPGSGTPALAADGGAAASCVLSEDGTTVEFHHPGSCTVTVSQLGGADYTDAATEQVFSVAKGMQAVAFILDPSAPTVGGTYDIRSTTKGSGTAPLLLTGNDSCTVDGTTVTFVHAGTCTVTATQAGDDDWVSATPVEHSVAVARRDQELLVTSDTPSSGVVDGGYTLTVTGGRSSEPIAIVLGAGNLDPACTGEVTTSAPDGVQRASVAITFTRVGSCTVAITQDGDDDHTAAAPSAFSIAVLGKATTTTLSLSSPAIVHGQPATATATVGGTSTGIVTFSLDGAPFARTELTNSAVTTVPLPGDLMDVGSHAVAATFAPADPNTWAASATAADSTIAVTPARSSVSVKVGATSLVATVTVEAPSTDVATGSVTFYVGGEPVGTADIVDGVATLAYVLPPGDSKAVSAVYSGRTGGTGGSEVDASSGSTARRNPTVTAVASSSTAITPFGWYSQPVTVQFVCSGGDGAVTCPGPEVVTRNGITTVTATVVAGDGGATTASITVKLDQTAPNVAIRGVADGSVYSGTLPKVRCEADDRMSGIAECTLTRTTRGDKVTYTAVAVDRAGNATHASATVGRSPVLITGARHRDGVPVVKAGRRYTLVFTGTLRPTYVHARPFPGKPRSDGGRFVKIGKNRWALGVVFTKDRRGHKLWSFGIRVGKKTSVVTVKVTP
ncbi:Ig-like domain repeat protein [Nocardioides sp.]|uniref:beta strand repeat-containing protein n=1 Tax=Nocardioides sp. TaxID=35761 RepID=UPI00261B238E|nr:Ig-like domain repeat protein [Nocardioides sp.]